MPLFTSLNCIYYFFITFITLFPLVNNKFYFVLVIILSLTSSSCNFTFFLMLSYSFLWAINCDILGCCEEEPEAQDTELALWVRRGPCLLVFCDQLYYLTLRDIGQNKAFVQSSHRRLTLPHLVWPKSFHQLHSWHCNYCSQQLQRSCPCPGTLVYWDLARKLSVLWV